MSKIHEGAPVYVFVFLEEGLGELTVLMFEGMADLEVRPFPDSLMQQR